MVDCVVSVFVCVPGIRVVVSSGLVVTATSVGGTIGVPERERERESIIVIGPLHVCTAMSK